VGEGHVPGGAEDVDELASELAARAGDGDAHQRAGAAGW
jgi:hypothetical protein